MCEDYVASCGLAVQLCQPPICLFESMLIVGDKVIRCLQLHWNQGCGASRMGLRQEWRGVSDCWTGLDLVQAELVEFLPLFPLLECV